MHDLHSSTDQTQETCAIRDHADYTGPTRKHELDQTISGVDYLSALKDLEYQVGIDNLSMEWLVFMFPAAVACSVQGFV